MTEGIKGIIAQLEHQRAAIDRALAALREVEGIDTAPAPAKTSSAAKKTTATPVAKKAPAKKGTITPEGRQKLAEAMKKRWAIKRANSAVKKRAGKKAK